MPRILLVEDDEAVRGILARTLVNAGYVVEEAANGDLALAAYRRQPSDVVVTDLVMPEKNGLEMIMEMRRLDPAVKIIAMSGGGRTMGQAELYLESAKVFGALQILAKPFTASTLLKAVSDVLTPRSRT